MQQLRDLLRTSLRTSLGSLSQLDRLATAWPVVAGHAIAERSAVTQFEGGVATVLVRAEGAWLDQLRRMTPQLRNDLASVSGVALTDILFLQAKAAPAWRGPAAKDQQE